MNIFIGKIELTVNFCLQVEERDEVKRIEEAGSVLDKI